MRTGRSERAVWMSWSCLGLWKEEPGSLEPWNWSRQSLRHMLAHGEHLKLFKRHLWTFVRPPASPAQAWLRVLHGIQSQSQRASSTRKLRFALLQLSKLDRTCKNRPVCGAAFHLGCLEPSS